MPAALGKSSTFRFCLLAFIALSLLAGLGLRDPSPPDEPRFVLAAQHMVESGHWLIPHRGREFYAEKPATFMWLQAAIHSIVRDWRVAFLLPSFLAALATLVLTWDLGRRLWTPRMGWYAAGALWVCLQFGLQAKRGQIDMVLVSLTTLSLWAFLRFLLEAPRRRLLAIGAFAAGLGTVTKGVGFLPLLVFVPWLFWKQRSFPHGAANAASIVLASFVAGVAIWLGPLLLALMLQPDPMLQGYVQELLFRQTAERYANPWHHTQPWWYYGQVMATLWLPGALLLPWLLPVWIRRLRRGDRRIASLVLWSAMVLAFFSLSPGKREVYIFPALPALCLAAAPLLPALLARRGVRAVLFAYATVLAFGALLLSTAGLLDWSDWARRLAMQREISAAALRSFLVWLASFGIAGVVLCITLGRRRIGLLLVALTGSLWIVYGLGLAPAVDAASSSRQLMQRVESLLPVDAELGMVAWREQNMLQAMRPATDFGFKQPLERQWVEAAAWVARAPERRWLFVLADALSPCVERGRAIAVGQSNRREWVLVPGTALRRDCHAPPGTAAITGSRE